MAEAVAQTLEHKGRVQQDVERSRVHPLDPDFLIVLAFAILVDIVDIVLEVAAVLIIPKLIGMVIDLIVFLVLSAWMYWRLGRIASTKQRGAPKTAVKRPLKKVLVRGGATFFGELVPFLGIMPFWTITVLSTLREQ